MSTTTSNGRTFVLASRNSQLAQIQTNSVRDAFQSIFAASGSESTPKFTTAFMSTAGDKNQSQALYLLGGKALWTKELEVALKEKDVDILVHCLKDVPTTLPEGCTIAAILEREDPVDSLVVKSWSTLEEFGRIACRKRCGDEQCPQGCAVEEELPEAEVFGLLNTRLAKLDAPDGPYAALVLAKAGLVRLGFGDRVTADLHPPTMFYAVSQGALAVEVRSDDTEAIECLAERACLRVLEGGCSVPVGVSTEAAGRPSQALNGEQHVQHTIEQKVAGPEDAEEVGTKLAQVLLSSGAEKILEDINVERDRRIVQAKAEDEVRAAS
ncbi:porphobilinogen deaminase, dipyromethane cofactor binding domain-containing protein [Ephemerocybe angulata]|uniref:hydroxymethylbilane synthase n=1 Tax=Ephemerocybe angulata TaxID=980116 RepID=A0A8H6IKV6_9AGAR|nr:porphobilinogen deaminase, dipyromethane cofactor binding domain-containing protein [Tulosesus angulatus]